MNTKTTLLFVLVCAVSACAADESTQIPAPADEVSDPGVETPAREQFQRLVDIYADALASGDPTALDPILSTELHDKGRKIGFSTQDFIAKQRASMLKTFDLPEDAQPTFLVDTITKETSGYAVTLMFRGQQLTKPTYFVMEDGELKLNIAPVGMTRGLRSTSNYTVTNTEYAGQYGDSVTMICDNNSTYVFSGQQKLINCYDHCGYWSGTPFQRYGGDKVLSCDWNSWGTDVYVNRDGRYYEGWQCNDLC